MINIAGVCQTYLVFQAKDSRFMLHATVWRKSTVSRVLQGVTGEDIPCKREGELAFVANEKKKTKINYILGVLCMILHNWVAN